MAVWHIALMMVVVFIAAIVQSTSGFGFGIVCMAILPIIIPYKQATVLVLVTCLFLQLITIIRLRHYIRWKLILLPALGAIVCGSLSVRLMLGLSEHVMSIILGLFLWILALYLMLIAPKVQLKSHNPWIGLVAGSIGGFMDGMFTIGGPPMVAYFDSIVDEPKIYQASLQTYFLLTTMNVIINNIICGNFTTALIEPACFTLTACLVGTLVGMKILDKISMTGVRKLAYLVMMAAGTYNLFKAFFLN